MRNLANVIVVGLITVAAAVIVFPLILRVRDAAARAKCTNNLKQTGLAMQNFHDVHGRFPLAGLPNPILPPEKRISWLLTILPYVEADNIYSRLNVKEGWDSNRNRFSALITIPVYGCPAYQNNLPDSTFTPTPYVGIAGLGPNAASLPPNDPKSGFFNFDRGVPLGEISARASTLVAVMETARASGAWTAAGHPTVRGLVEDDTLLGRGGQFGGLHRGGTNTLFADSSVHFLRDSIEPRLLKAFATIHGTEELAAPD